MAFILLRTWAKKRLGAMHEGLSENDSGHTFTGEQSHDQPNAQPFAGKIAGPSCRTFGPECE